MDGIAANSILRNANARVVLSSEDEWYKAAHHDATSAAGSYFEYPAGVEAQTTCDEPTSNGNSANCDFVHGEPTAVGSYPNATSPYGTLDHGGNLYE